MTTSPVPVAPEVAPRPELQPPGAPVARPPSWNPYADLLVSVAVPSGRAYSELTCGAVPPQDGGKLLASRLEVGVPVTYEVCLDVAQEAAAEGTLFVEPYSSLLFRPQGGRVYWEVAP